MPTKAQARGTDSPPSSRKRTASRCSAGTRLFFQQLFEQVVLQDPLSKQALEPCVLLLQFLEALGFVERHPAIGAAPAVEGVLSDAVVTTDGADRLLALLGLLDDLDDLLGRMGRGLHRLLLVGGS